MSKRFKRLLSLMLTLVMILGLTPGMASGAGNEQPDGAAEVHVYTEEENALIDNDVFAAISAKTAEVAQPMGGVGVMTEEDYIAMIPDVINIVKNSATYKEGTLQQNGNFLVWETTVGIPCCYSPRMEAELHNTENDPTPEEISLAEARAEELYRDLSEIQGGWPSSIDIGLIQPFWESTSNYADSSFNGYSPKYKAAWEAFCTATGGQGLRYSMSNANVDNIATVMSQCGLVMFDSHGDTDYSGSGGDYTSHANTSYIMLTTTAGITTQDTAAQTGQYGTYHHAIKSGSYAYVDGTCIGYHMGNNNAPHSFLYMGICLGMATDGMEAGLRAKGVEAVWGYSQSVSFYGDEKYVSALMGYLKNGDSLTVAAGKVKSQYGNWDPAYSNYSYSQCVTNHVAFPIVASSEDAYPGHGNVDVVQTVYSTWTLYSQYTVSAVSNNDAWGSVSVNENIITARPNYGYYTAGYEVIEGSAEVVQRGNVFTVTPSSDCTVQINFAEKPKYTVQYMANGSECGNAWVYVGESLTLPEMASEVEGWSFFGWMESELEQTEYKPDYLKPGTIYTPAANAVLYALYVHSEGGTGETVYKLLTGEPINWKNNYVITYGNDSSLYVMKGLPAGQKYQLASAGGAVRLADSGILLEGTELKEVEDIYIFEVTALGDKYSIRNLETDGYLADKNALYSSTFSERYGAWSLGMNGAAVAASSTTNNPYLSFSASKYFRMAANLDQPIYFWQESVDGIRYFSTTPDGWEAPHVHSYGEPEWTWTKSEDGYTAAAVFTCEDCEDEQTVEALVINTYDSDTKILTFTATAVFEEEEYTDTLDIDLSSVGYNANLELQENFNVNFYVRNLDEELAADVTVKWTFDGETFEQNLGEVTPLEDGRYRIVLAEVFSYQMTKQFEITVEYLGVNIREITYSVQQYFDNRLASNDSDEMKAIYRAALDYGAAAQLYFNGKTYEGGVYDCDVEHLANANSNPDNTITATKPVKQTLKEGSISGFTAKSASLVLGSNTEIRVSFLYEGNIEDLVISCDNGKAVTEPVLGADGRYGITIKGLCSYELCKDYQISFVRVDEAGEAAETFVLTYSPYTYAANKWENADADLARLMQAFVAYGDAAYALWGD